MFPVMQFQSDLIGARVEVSDRDQSSWGVARDWPLWMSEPPPLPAPPMTVVEFQVGGHPCKFPMSPADYLWHGAEAALAQLGHGQWPDVIMLDEHGGEIPRDRKVGPGPWVITLTRPAGSGG